MLIASSFLGTFFLLLLIDGTLQQQQINQSLLCQVPPIELPARFFDTRSSLFQIFPNFEINCNGYLRRWDMILGDFWGSGINLAVWRRVEYQTNSFRLVNVTRLPDFVSTPFAWFKYEVPEPFQVQMYDVIGLYYGPWYDGRKWGHDGYIPVTVNTTQFQLVPKVIAQNFTGTSLSLRLDAEDVDAMLAQSGGVIDMSGAQVIRNQLPAIRAFIDGLYRPDPGPPTTTSTTTRTTTTPKPSPTQPQIDYPIETTTRPTTERTTLRPFTTPNWSMQTVNTNICRIPPTLMTQDTFGERSSMFQLFPNFKINCDGYVTRWTLISRTLDVMGLYLSVWRAVPNRPRMFQIVGSSPMPNFQVSPDTWFAYYPPEPFPVQKGDIVGIYYGQWAEAWVKNGFIPVTNMTFKDLPKDFEYMRNYWGAWVIPKSAEEILEEIEFTGGIFNATNSTFVPTRIPAISVIVDPGYVPRISTTTTRVPASGSTNVPALTTTQDPKFCVNPPITAPEQYFGERSSLFQLFYNFRVGCAGLLTKWSMISRTPNVTGLYLSVWRPVFDMKELLAKQEQADAPVVPNYFKLIGTSAVPATFGPVPINQWVEFQLPNPFYVQANDVVGIYYSKWEQLWANSNGFIPVTSDLSFQQLPANLQRQFGGPALVARKDAEAIDKELVLNYGWVNMTNATRVLNRYPALRVFVDSNQIEPKTTPSPITAGTTLDPSICVLPPQMANERYFGDRSSLFQVFSNFKIQCSGWLTKWSMISRSPNVTGLYLSIWRPIENIEDVVSKQAQSSVPLTLYYRLIGTTKVPASLGPVPTGVWTEFTVPEPFYVERNDVVGIYYEKWEQLWNISNGFIPVTNDLTFYQLPIAIANQFGGPALVDQKDAAMIQAEAAANRGWVNMTKATVVQNRYPAVRVFIDTRQAAPSTLSPELTTQPTATGSTTPDPNVCVLPPTMTSEKFFGERSSLFQVFTNFRIQCSGWLTKWSMISRSPNMTGLYLSVWRPVDRKDLLVTKQALGPVPETFYYRFVGATQIPVGYGPVKTDVWTEFTVPEPFYVEANDVVGIYYSKWEQLWNISNGFIPVTNDFSFSSIPTNVQKQFGGLALVDQKDAAMIQAETAANRGWVNMTRATVVQNRYPALRVFIDTRKAGPSTIAPELTTRPTVPVSTTLDPAICQLPPTQLSDRFFGERSSLFQIFTNFKISCPGLLTRWSMISRTSNMTGLYLSVWRPVAKASDLEAEEKAALAGPPVAPFYRFVGATKIPATFGPVPVGQWVDFDIPEPFYVQTNDVVGIYYERWEQLWNNNNGFIPVTNNMTFAQLPSSLAKQFGGPALVARKDAATISLELAQNQGWVNMSNSTWVQNRFPAVKLYVDSRKTEPPTTPQTFTQSTPLDSRICLVPPQLINEKFFGERSSMFQLFTGFTVGCSGMLTKWSMITRSPNISGLYLSVWRPIQSLGDVFAKQTLMSETSSIIPYYRFVGASQIPTGFPLVQTNTWVEYEVPEPFYVERNDIVAIYYSRWEQLWNISNGFIPVTNDFTFSQLPSETVRQFGGPALVSPRDAESVKRELQTNGGWLNLTGSTYVPNRYPAVRLWIDTSLDGPTTTPGSTLSPTVPQTRRTSPLPPSYCQVPNVALPEQTFSSRNSLFQLFTNFKIGCTGYLTKWSMISRVRTGQGLFLSVWRPEAANLYRMVGTSEITLVNVAPNGWFEYDIPQPYAVQADDLVGIYYGSWQTNLGPWSHIGYIPVTDLYDPRINLTGKVLVSVKDADMISLEIGRTGGLVNTSGSAIAENRFPALRAIIDRNYVPAFNFPVSGAPLIPICYAPRGEFVSEKNFTSRSSLLQMFTGLRMGCDGYVTKWNFVSRVRNGPGLYLSVWRPVAGSTNYRLVGTTEIALVNVTVNSWIEYVVPEPFYVQSNDIVGIYYGQWDVPWSHNGYIPVTPDNRRNVNGEPNRVLVIDKNNDDITRETARTGGLVSMAGAAIAENRVPALRATIDRTYVPARSSTVALTTTTLAPTTRTETLSRMARGVPNDETTTTTSEATTTEPTTTTTTTERTSLPTTTTTTLPTTQTTTVTTPMTTTMTTTTTTTRLTPAPTTPTTATPTTTTTMAPLTTTTSTTTTSTTTTSTTTSTATTSATTTATTTTTTTPLPTTSTTTSVVRVVQQTGPDCLAPVRQLPHEFRRKELDVCLKKFFYNTQLRQCDAFYFFEDCLHTANVFDTREYCETFCKDYITGVKWAPRIN